MLMRYITDIKVILTSRNPQLRVETIKTKGMVIWVNDPIGRDQYGSVASQSQENEA